MFGRIMDIFPYFFSIFMAIFIVMFVFRKEIFKKTRKEVK